MLHDDTEAKLVTGVDDHSRFCVAAGLVTRATSKAVCEVLAASLARYGIPDEILTDNGKVFTGRFGPHPVEVLFDRILREKGISHRHTAVRSPTTTGKIERFHQSLRKEFLADRTFPSLEATTPMPSAVPRTWGIVRRNPNCSPDAQSTVLFGPGDTEPTNAKATSAVLTSPEHVRADVIRQFREAGKADMAELLILLEETEWARQAAIEELRGAI